MDAQVRDAAIARIEAGRMDLGRVRLNAPLEPALDLGGDAANQDALARISELAAQLSQEPARLGPLDQRDTTAPHEGTVRSPRRTP